MHIEPEQLRVDVRAARDGDEGARDRLFAALTPTVRLAARRMLGDDDLEIDDIGQESLVSALGYLRSDREFEGDLVRLAVTIARNRCRDVLRARARRPHTEIEPLSNWLASPEASALDDFEDEQLRGILQQALDRLGEQCRRLLHALYVEGLTPEQVRRQVGLGTVQGIYHRRSVCLKDAKKLVQRRLRFGSWADRNDP